MIKEIFKVLKKTIVSIFGLYGYNLIAAPLGFVIPINFITISLLSIFGIPALLSLVIVLVVVF
ncbi:MAG: hypothetical protein E7173_02720 [Firmicutes bacterium]|nr:hypothetical protein [Bacillota bacterium]